MATPDIHEVPLHVEGLTRVVHSSDGSTLFTAGDEGFVRVLPSSPNSTLEAKLFDVAKDVPIFSLAISSSTDQIIVAGESGVVSLHGLDAPYDFQGLLTRTSGAAVRCVAVEKGQTKDKRVAVCSDELIVKVIDVKDNKRVSLLAEHSKPVRAATWHPSEPLLTTSSSDGTIRVWDLSGSEHLCIKTIDGIIPIAPPESDVGCAAVWHPRGKYFAVVSKAHEIVVVSRNTWSRIGTFAGDHSGDIVELCFSPNGYYLASSDTKGTLMIWEMSTRTVILKHRVDSLVTSISWHPTGNSLAFVDNQGVLRRWAGPIPASYPHPAEVVDGPAEDVNDSRKKGAYDDAETLFGELEGEGDDVEEGVDEEGDPYGDDWIIDDDGGGYKKALKKERAERAKSPLGGSSLLSRGQPAFQPGSTPMKVKRRYLAFNMIGVIHAVDQDTHHLVTVEFHDKNARRGYHFTDHFKYTMAALGEQGALYACPSERVSSDTDEDTRHPSTVYYKSYESWGTSSDWQYGLPTGEDAVAIAVGGGAKPGSSSYAGAEANAEPGLAAVVVATSRGYLRFFTAAGLQRYVWTLTDEVVSMTASREWVFVITRETGAAFNGYQNLNFFIVSLSDFTVVQTGRIPLLKGQTLKWIGFTDDSIPAMYDSTGVLSVLDRVRREPGQARWVPALDTNGLARREGKQESYWPVGVSSTQLMCIILKGEEKHPYFPRPLIQELNLQMPLLHLDNAQGQLEEKFLRESILASLLKDTLSLPGFSSREPDLRRQELSVDKSLLQLVQLACKSDKHGRALDAAAQLRLPQSVDAAAQIAGFFHLPALQDKLQDVKEALAERREREEERANWRVGWGQASHLSSRVLVPASQDELTTSRGSKPFTDDFAPRSSRKPRRGFGTSGNAGEGQEQSVSSAAAPYDASLSRVTREDSLTSFVAESVPGDGELGEGPQPTTENLTGDIDDAAESKRKRYNGGEGGLAEDSNEREKRLRATASEGDKAAMPAPPKPKATNPFAKRPGAPTNPFAKRDVNRERSLHKTNSFFDRVDHAS